jgi:acetylornithine/N-succinyldiaminopimelate aminotransferase
MKSLRIKYNSEIKEIGRPAMANTDFLARANEILINVYNFWPVQFSKAKGVYITDVEGNKYLDFGAGIAVNSLGYGNKVLNKALKKQIDTFHMGLCYVADEYRMEAVETLLAVSEFDQVFLCNSGTEAVEGALKTARKWSVANRGPDAYEVIYVNKSFHGRSMGSLSVMGQKAYREGFGPLVPGMKEAEFNNLQSFKDLITPNTAAIIIEPIMGEGGIVPATQEFIQGLRDLCDEHNIALIFDEVQAGMGRTGTLFAYEQYGVVPDLITLAKGLGAGFPVGAYMGKRKFTEVITPGTHGGTYGGNPLASVVVTTVIKEMLKPGFLDNVEKVGKVLKDGLDEIARETNLLSNVRGVGMMLAADYNGGEAKDLVKTLLKNGLITLTCGENALRFVPPLTLTEKEAREGLKIVRNTLKQA